MPSGSKKRKAARKKKENESVSNHSNGCDDVKQQDDKDSDVGELSSPNSHDHDSHQSHLTEGEEEENEKGENISHTPAEEELKIKDRVEDDAVVPVDRKFEIEDKSCSKDDGSASGSSGGSDNSRSSSDDESNFIKKGEAIDIAPVVDLGNGNESLSGEPTENIVRAKIDGGVDISHTPAEEELKIKDRVEDDAVVPVDRKFEIEDKSSNKDDGSASGSSGGSDNSRSSSDDESNFIKKGEAIDIAPVVDLGNGNESLSGEPTENIVRAKIDGGVDSVVETSLAEELKNTLILGDKVETDTCIAPYKSEPMESEVKRPGFVEENGISKVFMDVPLKKDESIENVVTLDHMECATKESHDRVATDIRVELEKDSGVNEVLLVPAPRPVETTTWKSCCGLFEVFAGSRR